jgi:hypothetical protein
VWVPGNVRGHFWMKLEFQYLEAAESTDSWAVRGSQSQARTHLLHKVLSELFPIHVVSYKAGTFLIGS